MNEKTAAPLTPEEIAKEWARHAPGKHCDVEVCTAIWCQTCDTEWSLCKTARLLATLDQSTAAHKDCCGCVSGFQLIPSGPDLVLCPRHSAQATSLRSTIEALKDTTSKDDAEIATLKVTIEAQGQEIERLRAEIDEAIRYIPADDQTKHWPKAVEFLAFSLQDDKDLSAILFRLQAERDILRIQDEKKTKALEKILERVNLSARTWRTDQDFSFIGRLCEEALTPPQPSEKPEGA